MFNHNVLSKLAGLYVSDGVGEGLFNPCENCEMASRHIGNKGRWEHLRELSTLLWGEGSTSMSFRCYADMNIVRATYEKFLDLIGLEQIDADVGTCLECGTKTCTVCKFGAHIDNCPNDKSLQAILDLAELNRWQRRNLIRDSRLRQ